MDDVAARVRLVRAMVDARIHYTPEVKAELDQALERGASMEDLAAALEEELVERARGAWVAALSRAGVER